VISRHILPQVARMILVARLEEKNLQKINMDVDEQGIFCFSENGSTVKNLQSAAVGNKKRKSGKRQSTPPPKAQLDAAE